MTAAVDIFESADEALVVVHGDVEAGADDFVQALASIVHSDVHNAVVDLRECDFLGIRATYDLALVGVVMHDRLGHLVVRSPSRFVEQMLTIADATGVVEIDHGEYHG